MESNLGNYTNNLSFLCGDSGHNGEFFEVLLLADMYAVSGNHSSKDPGI